MAWTKMKTAFAAATAILLVAGTTILAFKKVQKHEFNDSWRTQDVFSGFKKLEQVPPQVRILPSKFHSKGHWLTSHGKTMGTAEPAGIIVQAAYGCEFSHRVVLTTCLPAGRYDFIANLSEGNPAALQQRVKQEFGVVAKWKELETNVLLLTVGFPDVPGLSPAAKKQPSAEIFGQTMYAVVDKPLTNLVNFLEAQSDVPVIDQTGLTGHFDFTLKWREPGMQPSQGIPYPLKQAMLNQLGLELVPGVARVEMLVVEKAE